MWWMDEEPYPGPELNDFPVESIQGLIESYRNMISQIKEAYGLTGGMIKVFREPPKEVKSHGPRSKRTFDLRGNRKF